MRTRHLIPALLTAGLLLAGCIGSPDSADDGGDGDATALATRLAAAKEMLDTAETLSISLSTKNLPDNVTGLLSATGKGNHSPAFEGKVTVVTGGASLGADVIATGGTVYAKTGFLPDFTAIDPSTLKAPDPASLFEADGGLTDILLETDDLAEDGQSRDGKDVLTTIKGSLPGSVVQTIIPSAAAEERFAVVYRLDDDDMLRDATLTGRFYPSSPSMSYTVALEVSDTPVTIDAP